MTEITLHGGPHDGRTLAVPDGCIWLNTASTFPERAGRHPLEGPRFWMHTYDAHTGIYVRGRMPADTVAIRVDPITGRIGRWLDRVDRWLTLRR